MDRAKLLERLMTTFLGELADHVRGLNEHLLALEKDADGPGREERLKALFREAHNLKGAARAVGVGLLEDACHRLEEILSAAQAGRRELTPPLFALLFESADAIEEAGMRLREQHDLADSPLAGLLLRLDHAAGGMEEPAPAPSSATRPAPAPLFTAPPPLARPDVPIVVERPSPPVPAAPPAPAPAVKPANTGAEDRPSKPATTASPEPSSVGTVFVRVHADKLDALLTRNGELIVARQRLRQREDDLAELRKLVRDWSHEWRSQSRPLARSRARGATDEGKSGPALAAPRPAQRGANRTGARLTDLEKGIDRLAVAMADDRRQLVRASERLDEEVRRVRMLPFAEGCLGLDRAARDVGLSEGKRVELVIEGGDVEIDRSVLEGLKDPLVHLVRNAVGHGIESPARRREAGKPESGRIAVTAALRGAQVEVVVSDDGAGLDPDALRRKASQRGLNVPVDDRDLFDLIFLPGFSTAPVITNISGRGVGLDVVKSRVEALHGAIRLESAPGRGARFTLSVPLTLTTLRAVLCEVAGQIFAVATLNVDRLLRIDPAEIQTIEGREVLTRGGPPLPVIALADALGLPGRGPARTAGSKLPALVVDVGGERRIAFVVDALLNEQEVLVKGLGRRVRRARFFSGATILPSGKVALVLNASGVVRAALGQSGARGTVRPAADGTALRRKRLLVVDDSVTTRTLEQSILEAAGYEVVTAVDGDDGWRMLQQSDADMVISDIEMPLKDGFALTEAVRGSSRFADLPVVLFTSRASEADKKRGIEVGANAYIVKGEFDQKDLLETIAQLL